MNFTRRARRFFAGPGDVSLADAFRRQSESFHAARAVVRCYYAALLFMAVATLRDWPAYLDRQQLLPLWPVCWLTAVPLRAGMLGILAGYLAGAFLGAVFPGQRIARALAFVGLIEFVALDNSFGKISHHYHLWVLTAFLLVFLPPLPARTPARGTRQRFLLVFWACQAIVLLTYSMSGVGKLGGAIVQICQGQPSILAPNGLASVIADRLLQTNSGSWLGGWLIAHPWAGWPLLLTSIYLEMFAVWVAFRPALHRWWAAGLILFHIGVYLSMTITFTQTVLLLGLLLLASPFQGATPTVCGTIGQLPVFSWVWRAAFPRLSARRTPL